MLSLSHTCKLASNGLLKVFLYLAFDHFVNGSGLFVPLRHVNRVFLRAYYCRTILYKQNMPCITKINLILNCVVGWLAQVFGQC